MDFSDIYSPVLLSTMFYKEKIVYNLYPFQKRDDKILVDIRSDVLIIDVTDKRNPFIFSQSSLAEQKVT